MTELSLKKREATTDRKMMWRQRDFWLSVLVLSGATLYRPITFWTHNAWDLAAPQDVVMTGLLELLAAMVLFLLGYVTLSVRPVSLSLLIGAVFFIIFNWHTIGEVAPALWMVGWLVAVLALDRFASTSTLNGVAIVSIVVLLVAPATHLAYAHVDQQVSYPIARSDPVLSAHPSGKVEDLLVLIVDGYPMPAVAERWFDHDTSELRDELTSRGFHTPDISWSQNTFTALAVPSMMELHQVLDETPKGDWRNIKDRYDISRGDSFVVSAFQAADFEFTHLESGWNGGGCSTADRCVEAPWYGDAQSLLLSSSILSRPFTTTFGEPHVHSSLATFDRLRELDVFGDGQMDYVFAHSLLPHGPFVVDSACSVRGEDDDLDPPRTTRVREQLECVDDLILEITASIPATTAVLIAGDHGPATNGQLTKEAAQWTDSDIAERLGAFLAYRLPQECGGSALNTNVSAMRAMVNCALDTRIPPDRGGFLIGEIAPQEITSSRIAAIEDKLASGLLDPS